MRAHVVLASAAVLAALAGCEDVPATNPFDPATPVSQQAQARLEGTVTLPDGFGASNLAEGRVDLVDGAGEIALTGGVAEGTFLFEAVNAGAYLVRVVVPGLVVADPELTFGLPPFVTAATGMDALAHCFEAFCAPGYHPMADGIAIEGMRLIKENLFRVFRDGHDATARTHMMMAASMGATAFQKGLGMVHSLSHPLGGATGIHHGLANAIFLPYVMEFNRDVIEERMGWLARAIDLPRPGFDGVMAWMLQLRTSLGLPHTLDGAAKGFDAAMAKQLAPLAARDPSQGTNPKPATEAELEGVFLKAWRGELDFDG